MIMHVPQSINQSWIDLCVCVCVCVLSWQLPIIGITKYSGDLYLCVCARVVLRCGNRPNSRVETHSDGFGSSWTRNYTLFHPIRRGRRHSHSCRSSGDVSASGIW
jgi:hypothetical protein